jgi:hypothetical protein
MLFVMSGLFAMFFPSGPGLEFPRPQLRIGVRFLPVAGLAAGLDVSGEVRRFSRVDDINGHLPLRVFHVLVRLATVDAGVVKGVFKYVCHTGGIPPV